MLENLIAFEFGLLAIGDVHVGDDCPVMLLILQGARGEFEPALYTLIQARIFAGERRAAPGEHAPQTIGNVLGLFHSGGDSRIADGQILCPQHVLALLIVTIQRVLSPGVVDGADRYKRVAARERALLRHCYGD